MSAEIYEAKLPTSMYPRTSTAGGPSCDQILGDLERRRQERSPQLEMMRLIRNTYNGDLIIPLPELSREERPAIANLIVTGIDQTAQRIASVLPAQECPPQKQGFDVHEEKARTATMAVDSWWRQNKMQTKMRRRARWFVGYASAPVVMRPDFGRGIPMWMVRDPLSSYPAPTQDPDDICPPDAIFTYFKSWSWLRQAYPEHAARLAAVAGVNRPDGALQFEMVEYVDCDVTVLGVLGPKNWGRQYQESYGMNTGPFMELERVANRTGLCPAVVPQRITLDRPKGQFDDAVGMYEAQARLMALEMIATEKGVFPDTYLLARPGETPQFISGPHDSRSGNINVVQGGVIQTEHLVAGPLTLNTIDRLERNQRVTSGVPSEFGGESPTSVRTGKRGDAIMAAVTSFPVQEAQEVFAEALQEENRRAIAIAKSYWGNEKRSFHISWKGKNTAVTYKANDVFTSDQNVVTYAMAGADVNGLRISALQGVGAGTLSKQRSMELDPLVENVEAERDRIVGEALEQAVLASLQAQAQSGQITPSDMGRIAQLVVQNKENLFGAIDQVQREAQERQASAGEPGTPGGPVAPGSPGAQPGLALPGMGQEQPTIGPPDAGQENLGSFLQLLRGGA